MNLANVKSITIPEGVVKALSIGGVKVWEKVSAPAFDKYSWEGVFASMDAGTYATDYAIGDTVPLDLGSEGVINMQIAAFDADDLADGSGKAKISWVAKELLATSHRMNPALVTNDDGTYQEGTGTVGGWEKCEMRTYLKGTIKPLIAETVASRIATVTKTQEAYDTAGVSFSQTTNDDVWVPARAEIYDTGGIYTAFFTDGASRIKYNNNSASNWWLREATSVRNFRLVKYNGPIENETSTNKQGVCLCFCTN